MGKNNRHLICKNCKETFFSKMGTAKFCSPLCRGRYSYKKKLMLKPPTIEKGFCKECSKNFTKNRINQIFCGKKCQRAYYDNKYKLVTRGVYVKNNKLNNYLRLRFEIFKRDNFTCQYCGRNVKEDGVKLNADHIIPKSKGGKDTEKNLITSCEECNLGKFDVLLSCKRFIKRRI